MQIVWLLLLHLFPTLSQLLLFQILPLLLLFQLLLNKVEPILHICHNHHNRWLCKKILSSVKFSNGYVNETAFILHSV